MFNGRSAKVNRKQFMEEQKATCANWNWSWSFINKEEKTIFFGAWKSKKVNGVWLIFSTDWEYGDGRKKSGYGQSREHIRLLEEEGYQLKIFEMEGTWDTDLEKMYLDHFSTTLMTKTLVRHRNDWYATDLTFES